MNLSINLNVLDWPISRGLSKNVFGDFIYYTDKN